MSSRAVFANPRRDAPVALAAAFVPAMPAILPASARTQGGGASCDLPQLELDGLNVGGMNAGSMNAVGAADGIST